MGTVAKWETWDRQRDCDEAIRADPATLSSLEARNFTLTDARTFGDSALTQSGLLSTPPHPGPDQLHLRCRRIALTPPNSLCVVRGFGFRHAFDQSEFDLPKTHPPLTADLPIT